MIFTVMMMLAEELEPLLLTALLLLLIERVTGPGGVLWKLYQSALGQVSEMETYIDLFRGPR